MHSLNFFIEKNYELFYIGDKTKMRKGELYMANVENHRFVVHDSNKIKS